MLKLTELDKKILFELDRDGRVGYSDIARTLGTTPQVIKYHFERLREYEAIKNFWAFIDYDRAGYSFFWAYWLKFTGLSKEKEGEIFADLALNKNIPILLRSYGWADAMICITTKDIFEHNKILENIFSKWQRNIAFSEMIVGLGFFEFPRTYLLGRDNEEMISFRSGGSLGALSLTDLDRKIMSIMQIDGRREFTKIAAELKVSVGTVHSSFKKLKKIKVINKTALTLNHAIIGMSLYRVLLKLSSADPKQSREFFDFCTKHRNIVHYIPVMGNWQAMLDIETSGQPALRDLMREIKYRFENVVLEIQSNEIYKVDKFSQMVIEYPNLITDNSFKKT